MVRVYLIYPLRTKGGFLLGEFGKAVQDSGGDRAYDTGCVENLLTNVLQLLSVPPKHAKFVSIIPRTNSFSYLGMGIRLFLLIELCPSSQGVVISLQLSIFPR